MRTRRVEHIAIAERRTQNVKLQTHGGSKIIFLDPSATANAVIELAAFATRH